MNEQIKLYERPTDDLRQVRHDCWHHVIGPWRYYTVQRRWEVQDGQVYYHDKEPLPIVFSTRPWHMTKNVWFYLKDEWRDLPEVSSEEIKT